MPFASIEQKREYQRLWRARRRAEFFADKQCCDCGSTEELTLDHRNPAKKISHNIWSWSKKRRLREVLKCDIRCATCHRQRHSEERMSHGISRYMAGCRCTTCRAAKSAALKRETRRARDSNPERE